MRYFFLSIWLFLCFGCIELKAQSPARLIQKATSEISKEEYFNAIETLKPLVQEGSENKEAILLSGYSYLNMPGENENALQYLELASRLLPLEKKPSRNAIEANFYLAMALHQNYKFNEAIALYKKLLTSTKQQDLINSFNTELKYSENALELTKQPLKFNIYSLGQAINSPYEEHSPIIALDESTIYFTSNRPEPGMERTGGGYLESIYVSYWRDGGWTRAEKLTLPGEYFGNRATVSLSADGQTIIFYQNQGYSGSLFVSKFGFNGWSEPEPLSELINSTYNETHASLSSDGNSIWFTSDRPGGYGGKDIYVSFLLPDGFWGEPLNAGPIINTSLDEESPFIHPDGNSLYFSSENHSSMGGFDIFRSKLDETGSWSKPENIGYPINTPDDDIFYLPTPDGQRVYYSSRQKGGMGETDIYIIAFPEDDARSLAVVASHIFNPDKTPNSDAVIRIFDTETAEPQGIFRPNSLTGKVVAILQSGRNYRIEIETPGFKKIEHQFFVPLRDVFGTRQRAFYVPSFILEKE
jgi:Tol biopolymer transport system component